MEMSVLCLNRDCYLIAAVLLFLLVIPRVSLGQDLPDLPIIYDFGIGARAMGMGQAHVAACEDVSAMFYNPAALAQIRRIEFSAGFSQLNDNLETFLFDHKSTTTLGSTKLSSAGIAYPFPTYRGSFVLGFGYNRTRNTDSDYFRFGAVPSYNLGPPYGIVSGDEKESIYERGGVSSWTVGLGTEISQDVSVGAGFSYLSGRSERQYEWSAQWETPPTMVIEHFYKSDDADITGWTASLGTLAKLGNVARIGLNVRLPEHLDLNGQEHNETYDQSVNDYVIEDFAFEDKITLPLTFMAGVSVAPVPGLILAFDAKYADWKQIDYAGPIRVENMYAYRATTSVRLGAEFMFPFAPLRVRGGFFTEPIAFRLLPDVTNSGGPWLASIDSDGKFYTLGAGYLLEESFTIDAAWVHGGYERSIPDYSEKKTTDKIYVSAGYHF
jgi:long-chain fatty acid transport protein